MTSLFLVLLVLCVLCVIWTDFARGAVCYQEVSRIVSGTEAYYVGCGWWGWSRCKKYRKKNSIVIETVPKCCAGSYGRIEDNCPGVCIYTSAKASSACPGNAICRDYQCDESGFGSSTPITSSLTFNENDNEERLLWNVDAMCFVQYSCTCNRTRRDVDTEREKRETCTCSKTVPCTVCNVKSTNGIAEVRNDVQVYRKECSDPTCRVCVSEPGCLDDNVDYQIVVECQASGYLDNDVKRFTFGLNVTKAETANINLDIPDDDESIALDSDAGIGAVVLSVGNITIPASEEDVTYTLKGPVSNTNEDTLFEYDETNREVKVNSDLSEEPSADHTLQLCVNLRRGDYCVDFVVVFIRITTTTTATTTTSTTTATTTTPVVRKYMCSSEGEWRKVIGMDWWCDLVCSSSPEDCPYLHTHCTCVDIMSERLNCTSVGIWKSLIMDGWCDLNCNSGSYSNCPTEKTQGTSQGAYCECGP